MALHEGSRLLLDDGKLVLRVKSVGDDVIETTVEVGGALSERKGVNVPDVVLPMAALTDKDRRDLSFAIQQGADWIALSFVQRPEDLAEARKLMGGYGQLLAKIEKPAAVARLDEILEACDAVMVARGDLGGRTASAGRAAAPEADRRDCAPGRQAGDRRDADARIDDQVAFTPPAPKSRTWRRRSMTAPTRSCSRPKRRRATGPSRRWR